MAALALGAVGVWMGTRFIATPEAYGHLNYKEKIVQIDEEGTVVTRAATGKPCRLIRNEFTKAWEKREHEILPFPAQFLKVGRPGTILGREEGDVDRGVLAAGQSAALVSSIKPARQVMEEIVEEAEAVLARLAGAS